MLLPSRDDFRITIRTLTAENTMLKLDDKEKRRLEFRFPVDFRGGAKEPSTIKAAACLRDH
jgi:hypothetical protein